MKKAFQDTLNSFAEQLQPPHQQASSMSHVTTPQLNFGSKEPQAIAKSMSDDSSKKEEDGGFRGFNFNLIPPFLKEVRERSGRTQWRNCRISRSAT